MERREDFRDLLAEFGAEKVEFLVIGGYAVGHYDRPRYTKDIDLWIVFKCPKRKPGFCSASSSS